MTTTLLGVVTALLGGFGLFLVDMILMTDGLKATAGDSRRRVLERTTGRPWSAFLSGVGLTAMVQPSSATTIGDHRLHERGPSWPGYGWISTPVTRTIGVSRSCTPAIT